MARTRLPIFNPQVFLTTVGHGKALLRYPKNRRLFSQGNVADAVFYIQKGQVELSVLSKNGKESLIAILEEGSFVGEGCLAGQLVCMATATTTGECLLVRVEKQAMIDAIHMDPSFSELFLTYILSQNIRIQEDLVHQLFNSTEKRLARLLLFMAHFGKAKQTEVIIPKISQEGLAELTGTTRSRVSRFMSKFRKLGFLENDDRGLHVRSSLINIV